MKEKIPIIIHLEGNGVEDGSILIEDLIPALQGFSSAYGKIASAYTQELNHKIKVESFKPGSFIINLYTTIMDNKDAIETIGALSGLVGGGLTVTYKVVSYILKTIAAKKHIKNEPYTQQINYNNSTVVLVNSDNLEMELPLDVFNIIKEKTVDSDLNKLVSIIDSENIDNVSISYQNKEEVVTENINFKESKYFNIDNKIVSNTDKIWITCKINSLTKTTNRGRAYLSDGTMVGFKLCSENPTDLYQFFIHNGWVKVFCEAKLDENLKPVELDVFKIEIIQNKLPFEEGGIL